MDSNSQQQQQQRRRASESEALALVSNHQYNRIPPPLPYLPSDYRPSPESPRHFLVTSANFDLNQSNKRQRSHSIGHTLAIESGSINSATSSTTLQPQPQQHYELVPYREWTVIHRNNEKGQLVLYNQDNQSVTIQHYLTDNDFTNLDPNRPIRRNKDDNDCPYCHRPLAHNTNSTSKPKVFEPDYMDRNYFRLLASSQTNSPIQSRSSTFSSATASNNNPSSSQNLNANAFNQGYYSKFFVQVNKLGKGFRGSVFLCEHMLDGVKLGKYAIKKVAIGNNHPWLVRMLREVHLLERLRHPNIVSYKHSWLEYNRLTPFGPEVPCLFILMECANGGNLEEYFEPLIKSKKEGKGKEAPRRMSSKELKRERIKKQLKEQDLFEQEKDKSSPVVNVEKRLLAMTEIWSLFLDIVEGLAHLHQQNIVHRDLKPPNLLLQYDDRNRNGHPGIPRVLISDFGECEDLDETTHTEENRTGATGTLEFMAPEHIRLDPRGRNTVDYSPKADMWSLGMVLYYLCYSRLPYSIIDDIDMLRTEILDFKDIRFPTSRFDIYDKQSTFYINALNNPNIQPDIPNELKILIRMLLSIDPTKRPSCNEILSKMRRIQLEENKTLYQDWSNNSNGSAPTTAANPSTSSGATIHPTPSSSTSSTRAVVVEEEVEKIERESSPKTKRSSTMETNNNSSGTSLRKKRPRLLHNQIIDGEGDTIMTEQEETSSPRLLLAPASSIMNNTSTHTWITDKQSTKAIKTVTAVLKIASCNCSCSPYSTKPSILYPVILLATLDFWSESSSPSFLLLVLHIVWIMGTALISGGLCEA